jgi:hypothetical protein
VAVLATQHIRAMRGGAQGHLMLGGDEELYVVKFQNNPQATRVLANEFLATRLAKKAGLSVPECGVVEVTPWMVQTTPELCIKLKHSSEPCRPGLQFGSRFVGGLMPGLVVDYLPEPLLLDTKNLVEFAGMLAIDKWTCNTNGRQAVFVRKGREKRYSAMFIDQGYCFNAADWSFQDVTLRGVFPRNVVYAHVSGWESFEPWLSRVEQMDESWIWETAEEVPLEWYGGNTAEIVQLIEKLLLRKRSVRDLITDFRKSDREPFPNWGKKPDEIAETVFPESMVMGSDRIQ